jgi:hypothetical protein
LGERQEQVVESHAETVLPHAVVLELVAQPQHRSRARLAVEAAPEQREHGVRGTAGRREGVGEALLHQVAARRGEQVVAPEQHRAERREQAPSVLLEPGQQPVDPEPTRLRAQVHRRHVFQVVRLVEHESAVGRQHGRLLPVVRHHAHGEVGREQVVVDYDHVGFGGPAPRLEQEAALEVRALEPGAQIRLRRHRVPHVAARLVGEVGEGAVARPSGPRGERL